MKKITLSVLVATLRDHGVDPDDEYTAAAGKDYGYVAAWMLPDGRAVIQYGSEYEVADDTDDLPAWLESTDLCGLDAITQTANVRGAEEVPAADPEGDGPYYILATRYWYGASETSSIVQDDWGNPLEFATYADAEAWIAAADNASYCTAHNESGREHYKIVA